MQIADLPPSYVTDRNEMVRAVSSEDLMRVAERLLKPEDLTFVVVGEPEGLDGEADATPASAPSDAPAAPDAEEPAATD